MPNDILAFGKHDMISVPFIGKAYIIFMGASIKDIISKIYHPF